MRYSETGYNLEIDLTTGNVERVESDPKMTELYLGGLGTTAKIMWDRVGPEVKPFDPENLLIFSTGLLGGTPCPGANRTIVMTVSPQTEFIQYSAMGGFFAPELKYAGWDKIILRGKSPKLVYIYIHNDKVEIRDAAHLSGKGAVEVQDLIRKELKEPRAHVAAIGLAGENKVRFASIEQGRSSASRLGLGAVMGDKGVKAIAVRGTKDINVARPAELMEHCDWLMDYMMWRMENPIPKTMPILAILGSPSCILLEEPSIGLQPDMVELLFGQVHAICKNHGICCVLVEHRIQSAMKIADHVLIMNNGAVVFDGTPAKAQESSFWEYF